MTSLGESVINAAVLCQVGGETRCDRSERDCGKLLWQRGVIYSCPWHSISFSVLSYAPRVSLACKEGKGGGGVGGGEERGGRLFRIGTGG